jgi:hypothetical protein
MKKCPVCDKTFEDSMRFCQTDGAPLVDEVEEAVDPFKTMVAPKEDFDAAIPPPPEDPFKTQVAGAEPKDSGDLLQLPEEEYDPLKTSVVSAADLPEIPQEDEIIDIAPPSPFDESPSAPPEPPKFAEPSLSPPDFGDLSGQSDAAFTEGETEIIPPDSLPKFEPFSSEPAKPEDFSAPTPIPSPFGETPSSYEKPSTSPYPEPEPPPTVLGASPFDQPHPFGRQENFQQNEWTPPPAPVANWQDQGLGANTPFQPPAATQGQDQTLALVSLICGITSFVCFGPLAAIPAIITGYMQKNKIKADPVQYGGSGLATAGMILGGVYLVLFIIVFVIYALLIISNM